ncbi:MAG: CBS domain-containing protein [Planctomycetes bacterium]|nr:CBS domain-containing protein [Planctomycetota bacterium]
MLVKEIMTIGIETIDSDLNVCQAAKKMRSLGIGSLPVQQGNQIVGIISKKDIVNRCVAEDGDPLSMQISEIMTKEIATCWEDETIEEAAAILEQNQLHRLLVMSNENEPVGIVSLGDMAVKAHDEHLAWEVLERISEPAMPDR